MIHFILFILGLFAGLWLFWSILVLLPALIFSFFCMLFGHNNAPMTVPNKAIWG